MLKITSYKIITTVAGCVVSMVLRFVLVVVVVVAVVRVEVMFFYILGYFSVIVALCSIMIPSYWLMEKQVFLPLQS